MTETEPDTMASILQPLEPNKLDPNATDGAPASTSARTRLESTYLEVTPPNSRRSSHSSQNVTMTDVENEAGLPFKVTEGPTSILSKGVISKDCPC